MPRVHGRVTGNARAVRWPVPLGNRCRAGAADERVSQSLIGTIRLTFAVNEENVAGVRLGGFRRVAARPHRLGDHQLDSTARTSAVARRRRRPGGRLFLGTLGRSLRHSRAPGPFVGPHEEAPATCCDRFCNRERCCRSA